MELIDTDVLIDVQRGHPPALAWFANLDLLPAIPGFVVMELIQDACNAREVQQALSLIGPFEVVWPTEDDCSRALAEFSQYHVSDGLGLLDALIGACAVGLDATLFTLFTFNAKHYRVVPGLVTAEPYAR